MLSDVEYMRMALDEARAGADQEVPIGAILVWNDRMLARGSNHTIRDCDPTAHAEMIVLREGAKQLGNYRLGGATLYATVEPCAMCAGAIVQARIARLVYGCDDPRGGAVRSCFMVLDHSALNHRVDVTSGVLAADCAALLHTFFTSRR